MSAPPVAASCSLSREGAVVDVPVGPLRQVCYEFDTRATNADLKLPYVVEVNGHIEPAHAGKPAVLTAGQRKIRLQVASGSKVALYLNSDASPDFRQRAVYALTVGERDVMVKITERLGRNGHERSTLSAPECRDAGGGRFIDFYNASLTGDIWMEISHVYTVAEADARLPRDLPAAAREALLRIYAGLVRPELLIPLPATNSHSAFNLLVQFLEQETVSANTTHCPLLTSILPRVHPAAFAALVLAAHACGVTLMQVNSAWRTSFGSIAHRAGLGIDVRYLENRDQHVSINRAALRRNGSSSEYVTQRERELYEDFEEKKRSARVATDNFNLASRRNDLSNEEIETLRRRKKEADKARDEAKEAWSDERNLHEPSAMASFRGSLRRNLAVSQILDPWYVDLNTQDARAVYPNEQRTELEKGHNNHLHITVKEEKIL